MVGEVPSGTLQHVFISWAVMHDLTAVLLPPIYCRPLYMLVCASGGAPTPLAHRCSKFHTQALGGPPRAWAVADLGGVRGVQMHPPLAASNVFCVHNCTSPSNDYAAVACSNNNQAQLHTHVSVPYWSPDVWLGLELLRDIQFGPRGLPRRASAYEISKSTGFHLDFGFQSGFLDFSLDFWIAVWISVLGYFSYSSQLSKIF